MPLVLPSVELATDWKSWARALMAELTRQVEIAAQTGSSTLTSESLEVRHTTGTVLLCTPELTFDTHIFLLCDGAIYSNIDYPLLAKLLGTAYSLGGDPADTFRVPDYSTFFVGGPQVLIKT